jgi:N-methylhydantoinase A
MRQGGSEARPHVVATDMGGTFVDAVLIDPEGRVSYGKASVTPNSPSDGLFAAIADAAGLAEKEVPDVIAGCRRFVHGTTVTTNAMIQRSGGPTGLLITRGFEDTLPIGRVLANTAGLDEAALMKRQHAGIPTPVIPAHLTRGISERIDYRGRVLCPLDPTEVEQAVQELVEAGARSLAVCLFWSFRNPVHEQWIREFVRQRHSTVDVTISSDLIPAIGEYERANTTAVNAYLQPVFGRYVSNLDDRLKAARAGNKLMVMQSIGGIASAEEVRAVPVTTLYSGPVGGIIAARRLGELIGDRNIITTDMGGTSFDVGLIVDGEPEAGRKTVLERNVLLVPAVQIATVGAGGGSLAWLDAANALRVGPQSQGAVPGPACYGRGGVRPTVTDADVVLGYINPEAFLGGRFVLDRKAAERALNEHVAKPLGMSVTEAAAAVYTIVNAHMADLVRQVSIGRGHDPRSFTLVSFGGCGPTHVTGYGPELGTQRIVVPFHAPVFSALGIGASDVRHFHASSVRLRLGEDVPSVEALDATRGALHELTSRARRQISVDQAAVNDAVMEFSADMRYEGQVNELTIPISEGAFDDAGNLPALQESFRHRYEQRYGAGSSSPTATCEVTMLRLAAILRSHVALQPPRAPNADADKPTDAHIGTRDIYWPNEGRYVSTPVYRGGALTVGRCLSGPAVIEMYATSVPLPPGQNLTVDEWSNLIITNQ